MMEKFNDYVVIKIKGGLGNQMFQYAFGLAHLKKGREVFFDTSWYKNHRKWYRTFDLINAFDIEFKEIKSFNHYVNQIPRNLKIKLKLIGLLKKLLRIRKFYSLDFSYFNIYTQDPRISINYYLSQNKGYFEGYWQNLDYFDPIKEDIFNAFSFSSTKSIEYNKFKKLILESKKNCSLHWRRGDYLELMPEWVLSENYFIEALKYLITKRNIENCFVFSEDCDFVKERIESHFPFLTFYYAYDLFKDAGYYHEVKLMSECSNNIISRSTFSWWGAYLNKNPDNLVIAPYWKNRVDAEYSNFLPENWIKLDID